MSSGKSKNTEPCPGMVEIKSKKTAKEKFLNGVDVYIYNVEGKKRAFRCCTRKRASDEEYCCSHAKVAKVVTNAEITEGDFSIVTEDDDEYFKRKQTQKKVTSKTKEYQIKKNDNNTKEIQKALKTIKKSGKKNGGKKPIPKPQTDSEPEPVANDTEENESDKNKSADSEEEQKNEDKEEDEEDGVEVTQMTSIDKKHTVCLVEDSDDVYDEEGEHLGVWVKVTARNALFKDGKDKYAVCNDNFLYKGKKCYQCIFTDTIYDLKGKKI